jgi:GTP-binding protein
MSESDLPLDHGDSEWPIPDDADEEAAARLAAEEFEFQEFASGDEYDANRPVVAIIGRPNVGKSSLVNRIIGRREAVVEDKPGVTRDRVAYDAEWTGHVFTLLDTGGYEIDAKGFGALIAAQSEIAVQMADVVVLVVDGQVGATDDDEHVIRVARKANKPIILAANKVDDDRIELEASALWNLGLGEPHMVSATHGRGSGDLLDAIVETFSSIDFSGRAMTGPHRVTLVGKPNVGKSSLLNKLAGENRVVVDDVAGTTVDPVDELVEIDNETWRMIDTAGIRRRADEASGHEYYAVLRTRAAIEKAEVVMVLVDAGEPIAEQDQRILSMVVETGRALVLVFNKWDLVDEERRYYLEREIETELQQVEWAPRVNIAALTGRNVGKIGVALNASLEGWQTRISTGKLNQFLGELVASHPHPVRGGKQPRILFGTQAGIRPPTFILFTTGYIEAGYRRYIERRLREEFGFEGSPIRIQLRIRTKKQRS